MPILRAVPRDTLQPGTGTRRAPGPRLPGDGPYLVDDLCEYARPDDKPSRRQVVYASPTPV